MSSKKTAAKRSGPDNKSGSKKAHKGELIFHSVEESRNRIGKNPVDVVEKSVIHAEDKLFCKFFEKKNGKVTKITVASSGEGKEYELTIKRDNEEPQKSKHDKKTLIAYLKNDPNLNFMLEYIEKAKNLARNTSNRLGRSGSRSASASRGRSGSRGKAGTSGSRGRAGRSGSRGRAGRSGSRGRAGRSGSRGKERTKGNSKVRSKGKSKGRSNRN